MSKALRLFPELSPTEIAAGECPSDPLDVLSAVQHVLPWVLVYRDGTYHLRTCMDAGVNTRRYGCSEKCLTVQIVLVWINASLKSRSRRKTG